MICPRINEARAHFIFGLWLRGLGLATINHAYLTDYGQTGWFTLRILTYVSGLILLFMPTSRPHDFVSNHLNLWRFICWCLFLSKIYTLFFLKDVLTQSLLLSLFYLISALTIKKPHLYFGALRSISLLTASTYFMAILHKLNSDFLFSTQSCAIHGFEVSLSLLPSWTLISDLKTLFIQYLIEWPLFPASIVIILEWSLCLLCIYRSKLIWVVGLIFHLPLTLTIAPSFGSVMAVGWGAGTILPQIKKKYRGHKIQVSSIYSYILALYVSHGLLSPYVGIEVQHSAAMLSNLRVDPACANSLIMPSLGGDPYVYIEEARFGQRSLPKRRLIVKRGLWNLTAISTMQANWCIPEHRPLQLSITHRGQSFLIDDLCRKDALVPVYNAASIFALRGWQRYQKNLQRQCHQTCVH
jgi:hypothetical protein